MKPSEFLEMVENESLRLSEAFSEDGYELTLWWGVDGLRMDDRGHCEWIKREVPKRKSEFGISTEEAIKAFTDLSNVAGGRSFIGAAQYSPKFNYLGSALNLPREGNQVGDIYYVPVNGHIIQFMWTGIKWEEMYRYVEYVR